MFDVGDTGRDTPETWEAGIQLLRQPTSRAADQRGTLVLDSLTQLAAVRRRLDAMESRLLAEANNTGITIDETGHRTGIWHARTNKAADGPSKTRVRVACRLRSDFPLFQAALEDGRISWDHCVALVRAANPRIADQLADLQEQLIDLAEAATFGRFQRELSGLAELIDQDGGFDPDDSLREGLTISQPVNGETAFGGILTGANAETFRSAIEAETHLLHRRYVNDNRLSPEIAVPSYSALQAMALANICRKAAGTDLKSSKRPGVEISLRVSASEPDETSAQNGTRLADSTTRALHCDATWFPIIVDSLGAPLDAGHAVRLATSAQRRALIERDDGCVFPGCDAPASWCDAHHVDHWENAGRTDLRNLALLCRHHHGITHRSGWEMHAAEGPDGSDGWVGYTWRTPTGNTLRSQHRTKPPPQS